MKNGVNRLDKRASRLVNDQPPVRTWLGKPVKYTGMVLPYGKGGYRHGFGGDCGCNCGGLGAASTADEGPGLLGWALLVGGIGAIAYALLQPR